MAREDNLPRNLFLPREEARGYIRRMSEPREAEWVVVRRFVNTTSAEMAADFLKDSGIPVIVQGQHAAEVLPASIIEIDLLVP